jgi:hypothetical protein
MVMTMKGMVLSLSPDSAGFFLQFVSPWRQRRYVPSKHWALFKLLSVIIQKTILFNENTAHKNIYASLLHTHTHTHTLAHMRPHTHTHTEVCSEEYFLLGCDSMQSGWSVKLFCRKVLPPSSGFNFKPIYCLLTCLTYSSTLMMEAVHLSKM